MTHLSRRTLLATTSIAAASLVIPSSSQAVESEFIPYIPSGKAPRTQYWAQGRVLNQGSRPACEAFALVGSWLSATNQDITSREGNRLGRYIFNKGGDPNGISGSDAMKIAKELGMARSWTWPQTVDELVDAVCYQGPTNTCIRMNNQLADTTGREIQGPGSGEWQAHAMVATAYLPYDKRSGRGPSLRLRNSWGPSWGLKGSAWMTVADLKRNLGPRPHVGYYQDMIVAVWNK